ARPLRWLAKIPGAKMLLRAMYRALARRRYRLSSACGFTHQFSSACGFTHQFSSACGFTDQPAPRSERVARFLPAIVLVSCSLALGLKISPWIWMWTIAVAIYLACKWITWWDARGGAGATWMKTLAYFFTDPSMDAAAFLGAG